MQYTLFKRSISLLLQANLLRAPLPRSRLIPGPGAATTTAVQCQPYVRQPQASHLVHTAIMALPQSAYKDRQFLAVIGDEVCTRRYEYEECAQPANTTQDTVTGILLAGVGVGHHLRLCYEDPLETDVFHSMSPKLQTRRRTTSSSMPKLSKPLSRRHSTSSPSRGRTLRSY